MYRTISLRLNHRYEEDKKKLLKTMEAFALAYNMSAEYGFEHRIQDKISNSMAMYHKIREAIPGLPGAMVQTACFMATDALKGTKFKVMPRKSPTSCVRYTWRAASVYLESGYAMIQTMDCRVVATFKVPDHFAKYADWKVKCSYLRFDKGTKSFYLNVAVENQDVQESEEIGVLGIDRGLRNLAVCSNNKFFNSSEFKRVKGKNAFLRAQLQAKGTHSAKRKLKKLAGRERRFVACINHRMAKEIVSMPYKTFVLEDLTGIRSKRSAVWQFRRDLSQWPYGEFRKDLEYKAEELGKEVLMVNAMYTSQKCSRCGRTSHKSRKGALFNCVECGFQIDADLNAARNIAQIGKSALGRLQASKPNTTSNESVSIRGPKDDELSCKSLLPEKMPANSTEDNWHSLKEKTYGSTTAFIVECGWTGTRLGGYKPSKREMAEKQIGF
jgi:putative transposase